MMSLTFRPNFGLLMAANLAAAFTIVGCGGSDEGGGPASGAGAEAVAEQGVQALDRLLRRKSQMPRIPDMDLSGLDAVVGMVATPLLDELAAQSNIPFLHITDATPAFLRESYGWAVPAEADHREARVAGQAAMTIYTSDVMAARAPADLGLPKLTASVLPFGVNFDHLPERCLVDD